MRDADIIVIGGGIAGLVATSMLSNLGVKVQLLERSPELGGANRSFVVGEDIFDYGYHALDDGRSWLTTRVFEKALNGAYRRFQLKRGIVLNDVVIDYNAPEESWPTELRELLEGNWETQVPDEVSFDSLALTYGKKFVDYLITDVLASYPSIQWAIDRGGKPDDYLSMVYPWFCPRRETGSFNGSESERYHLRMRQENSQNILYPSEGGFGSFMDGLANGIDGDYATISTGLDDITFETDLATKSIKKIWVGEQAINAPIYLWCTSPAAWARTLGWSGEVGEPQALLLGSFVFDSELESAYHEILVGSLEHSISRISFPGLMAGRTSKTVQVEFLCPASLVTRSSDEWRDVWLSSLKKLGVVRGQAIRHYSFLNQFRGFVTSGPPRDLEASIRAAIEDSRSNVLIPYFNLGPENMNRVVPGVIASIAQIIERMNSMRGQ